jgi:DNA-binding response OmpR family regulator
MLRMTFEDEGYPVTTAPDGRAGVRAYEEDPADLVITDLVMPEQEGLETIQKLRGRSPDLKIIAISGGGRLVPDTFLTLAKKIGADRAFRKPVDRKALLAEVRELLGE